MKLPIFPSKDEKPSNQGFFMVDFFSEKYPFTLKFGAKLLIASRKCKGPSGETSYSFSVSPPGTSCLFSFPTGQ